MFRVIIMASVLGSACCARVLEALVKAQLATLIENWTPKQKVALVGFDDEEPEATSFRTLAFAKVTLDADGEPVKQEFSVGMIPRTAFASLTLVEDALKSGTSNINEYLEHLKYLVYNEQGTYYLFWHRDLDLSDAGSTERYLNDLFESASVMSETEKQIGLALVHQRFQADEAKRRQQQDALRAKMQDIKDKFRQNATQFQKEMDSGMSEAKRRAAYRAFLRKQSKEERLEMALAELMDAQDGLKLEEITAAYKAREAARASRIGEGAGRAHRSLIFRLALKFFKAYLDEDGAHWSRIQEIRGIESSDWENKTTFKKYKAAGGKLRQLPARDLVAEIHFQDLVSDLQDGHGLRNLMDHYLFILVDDLGAKGGYSCDPTCFLIWRDPGPSEELVTEVKDLIRGSSVA